MNNPDQYEWSVNDLVEDREGDKAVIREIYEDGYVGIEWDCNPKHIARIHKSRLSNISEVVDSLRKQ
jgi:isocitrate dehydrogenase